ncbi:hypothetical protein OGAPHI_006378 [Ogataea philodendri]|uniref:RNA polymerase-associated protein CTR9 n=2 Tax=Saccharomycotina TaxID=147537 RepID=A0A9P8NXE5_9ASCO|nr:uncharacterized protein OGAPHI_006378 [Ogataea philodendri]KAH3661530.1 hypothetical protein OGAPHI_006378 [Ogataea philodendri]
MPVQEDSFLAVEETIPLNADCYLSTLDEKQRESFVSKNITIPLKEEGEEVVIDTVSDLPEDSSELCALLTNEESAAEHWLVVAKAYASQGKIDESLNVIRNALDSPTIMDATGDVQSTLHGFLAWLYLAREGKASGSITYEMASKETETALSLDSTNELTLLSQALLSLSSGKQKNKQTNFEKESRSLDNILKKNPKNCFALVAKAKIFFYKENYTAALKVFQRVLMLNPLLRPDPRIGIGMCYWMLDRKKLANQAWQNSIQVNPEKNLEAKILISIAKFDDAFTGAVSDEDFKEKYTLALEFTKASYIDAPTNGVILLILASFYFSKGDYALVEKVGEKLSKSTTVSSAVKSDAFFWLARCKFVQNDALQAQKYFSSSIKLNENNLLARFGYGQCLVLRNDINDAIRSFEKLQASHPRILEVTFALGMLYSKNPKQADKAISFLEKYVSLAKEHGESLNTSALITLATLYETRDISQSLKFLTLLKEKEVSLGKSDTELSFALLNNIGVLSLLKNENDPLSYFENSLQALESQEDESTKKDAIKLILNYNVARCKESQNDIESAKLKYQQIIEQCPGYHSARLRWLLLTCLSDKEDIHEELTQLLDEASDDLEVRSFYGWYVKKFGKKYMDTKGKDLESEHHRETLVKHTSHDCYALVSLGNVYATLAREAKDQQKKEQYYTRGAQLYQKVLSIDPKDAYAAQGIAIIFADKKQIGLALEIFRKVRESLQDISVYMNLGHCFLEAKQYAKSIESYQLALTRFTNGQDANILNFISRAWLYRAMSEKNLEYFKTSLEIAEKSFKFSSIPSLRFNIAFVHFQIAEFLRKQPSSKRTISDLEECVVGLGKAIETLNDLAANESHLPFPAEELKLRANMGNTLTKQLEKAIAEQKDYEGGLESKLREAKKLKTLEEQRKLEQKKKEEEERKKLEEKLAEERKQLEETTKAWNQQRLEEDKDNRDELDVTSEDKPKKKKGGRKKKKEFVVESEDEDEEEVKKDESEDDKSDVGDLFDEESDDEKKRKAEDDEDGETEGERKKSKPDEGGLENLFEE